jgi:hypothetical protein
MKIPLGRILPAPVAAALILMLAADSSAQDHCVTCHQELDGELAAPVRHLQQRDIHAQRGFSCADCHGGDPAAEEAEAAMSPQRGFRGVPRRQDVPELCGRCHSNPRFIRNYDVSLPTDQVEKYWTSHHGQALKQGDTHVATCVDCHGVHTILPADNPLSRVWATNVPATCRECHGNAALMSSYNLPSDGFEQYAQSVHGIALLEKRDTGAPACNDCHGNHGATPPGFESVAQVCRACHPGNSEMFLVSPHKAAFDAAGLPECAACHNHHLILKPSDAWLGVEGEHSCGECHSQGEPGYRAALVIESWIDSLTAAMEQARELTDRVDQTGIEIAEAHDALNDARNALLKSRTVVHTVRVDSVRNSVTPGLEAAQKATQLSRAGLENFQFRKRGLGIASILITLLIVAIWLKLRQIEKR